MVDPNQKFYQDGTRSGDDFLFRKSKQPTRPKWNFIDNRQGKTSFFVDRTLRQI